MHWQAWRFSCAEELGCPHEALPGCPATGCNTAIPASQSYVDKVSGIIAAIRRSSVAEVKRTAFQAGPSLCGPFGVAYTARN